MEWKEVTLGEIGTIVGGATPSTKNTSFYDGNIPWLTPKDLSVNSNKYILRGERNITEAGFKSCSCKMLPKGSVLFSSRAPIGYVAITANDMCTNQGFKSVIPNEETDSEFLYYLLKYNKDNIASQGSGTTFAEVSGKTMKEIEVMVPKETDDQRRIASILSSLDRKIELNNKINADLEEMAQAIFKNWFVDFEPFKDGKFVDSELGMIPEGWKVGRADDFYQINIGKTPPRKEHKWFSTNPADKIWVSIANMGNSGIFISDSSEYLTKEAVDRHNIIMVPRNTILLSFKLTVGRVAIADKELTTNEAIARFILSDDKYMEYLYLYLKKYDYNSLGSTSSIATAVNSKTIKGMQMLQPSDKIIDAFHIQVNPIFEKIRSLTKENSRLSLLRDTLLPRLMSGELEVPE